MMKKQKNLLTVLGVFAGAISLCACGENPSDGKIVFTPRLDTEASAALNLAGFFDNIEFLDKVKADFLAYYPNVTFNYNMTRSDYTLADYLAAADNDIFMVSAECFASTAAILDYCLDIESADIDLSDVDPAFLKMGRIKGMLRSVPFGQNTYGVVVNEDILTKNNLAMPTNLASFKAVCTKLKEAGYTPIQAPTGKVYSELTVNMMANLTSSKNGRSKDTVESVFDLIDDFKQYTDAEVDGAFPEDNYDYAIKKFLSGEVPFWVCNSEKVSGMKKRESRVESYQSNPFKYTYINAPIGENGCYAFSEPWYGFAINRNSHNMEYAKEFYRFLVTEDELNKMAFTKGIPSVAKNKKSLDAYKTLVNPSNLESSFVNDGSLTYSITASWFSNVKKYIEGTKDRETAIDDFVSVLNNSN